MRDVFNQIDTQEVSNHTANEGIQIFSIRGSSQYVVHFQNSEFSFTSRDAAENFALELAQKRENFRTASMDLSPDTAEAIKPPTTGLNKSQTQTKGRAFWRI